MKLIPLDRLNVRPVFVIVLALLFAAGIALHVVIEIAMVGPWANRYKTNQPIVRAFQIKYGKVAAAERILSERHEICGVFPVKSCVKVFFYTRHQEEILLQIKQACAVISNSDIARISSLERRSVSDPIEFRRELLSTLGCNRQGELGMKLDDMTIERVNDRLSSVQLVELRKGQ